MGFDGEKPEHVIIKLIMHITITCLLRIYYVIC